MNNADPDTRNQGDGFAPLEVPPEVDGAPPETPASETRALRCSIQMAPGAEIDPEVCRIAEFWLNLADGDAL